MPYGSYCSCAGTENTNHTAVFQALCIHGTAQRANITTSINLTMIWLIGAITRSGVHMIFWGALVCGPTIICMTNDRIGFM